MKNKKRFLTILSVLLFAVVLMIAGCTPAGTSKATSFRANDLSKVQKLVCEFDHYTVRRRYDKESVSISEYKVTPECIAYLDANHVQTYIVYNDGNCYKLTETDDGYARDSFEAEYSSIIAEAYNYFSFDQANWNYDKNSKRYTSELLENVSISIQGTVVSIQLNGYSIELYNFGATEVTIPNA